MTDQYDFSKGSWVKCFQRNPSPRASPESRSGWTSILWDASIERRRNPEAPPGIKRSSMRPCGSTSTAKAPKFEDRLRGIIPEELKSSAA